MAVGAAVVLGLAATTVQVTQTVKEGDRQRREHRRAANQQLLAAREQARFVAEQDRRRRARAAASFGAAGVRQAGTPVGVQIANLLESSLEQERILSAAAISAHRLRRRGGKLRNAARNRATTQAITSLGSGETGAALQSGIKSGLNAISGNGGFN